MGLTDRVVVWMGGGCPVQGAGECHTKALFEQVDALNFGRHHSSKRDLLETFPGSPFCLSWFMRRSPPESRSVALSDSGLQWFE